MKNFLLIVSLIPFFIQAQEKEKDSIGTEEVNVVKPYTPTIKDAFKLKKTPKQGKDKIQEKKEVQYSIHSVPVASTFTPSKGKAKSIALKHKERIYQNFVQVGFGTYTTPLIEAFVHTSTTRDNDFGLWLNYLSSNGGIKDVVLDDSFADANIDLFYKQETRDFDWKINGGYRYQKYHWYGLLDPTAYTTAQLNAMDVKQTYGNVNIGGTVNYYESFFKEAKLDLNLFSDAYKSNEMHVNLTPKFLLPVADELIETDFRLEYINGKMDKDYTGTGNIKYGFYNLGVSPTFKVIRDDLKIDLGAKLVYSGATQTGQESKFYIYPNLSGSYQLIIDVLSVYASVTGDLQQHSYRQFVTENPFVSPTLNIGRTNTAYDARIGFKGRLASNISFNAYGEYKMENAKALFMLNSAPVIITEAYQNNNSFGVVYDDVKTFGGFGELTLDLSKELQIGGNASLNTYNLKTFDKAWNLPNIKATVFATYTADSWFANANLFFVGDRKDYYINYNAFPLPIASIITNKSYVDLNLKFGYQFKNRLTFFAQANNVFGGNYERYTNFKVQGIQFLAGLKYKFDLEY
ncbi:MAG TPA: TonB-dependent receptor [Flavobacteriia bacterium]|nr:TonB-dependent receptor [Flavobacteriia bacterium]